MYYLNFQKKRMNEDFFDSIKKGKKEEGVSRLKKKAYP